MLHTDDGWQLIGVQSSAPPRKIAGAPITGPFLLPVFAKAGSTVAKIMFKRCPTARTAVHQASFTMIIPANSKTRPIHLYDLTVDQTRSNLRLTWRQSKSAPQCISDRQVDPFNGLRSALKAASTAARESKPNILRRSRQKISKRR